MNKKARIYISGPITGRDDAEHIFAAEEEKLKKQWEFVWNPEAVGRAVAKETGIEKHTEYMKISIAGLDLCNAIWMLPGWTDSTGAVMEYNHAVSTGKLIFVDGKQEIKEALEYVGNCIFCGKIAAIQTDEILEEEEIHSRATMMCNCEGAGRYQRRKNQRAMARETIEETFTAERAAGMKEAMIEMIDFIGDRSVSKVTIKKDEYIGTMSYSEKNDAIKIGYEKKNKIETEV